MSTSCIQKPVQVIKGLSIHDLRMPSCCHWTNCNLYISISKQKVKKKKKNNGPIDFNGIVLYLGWLTVSWFFRSSIIIRVCLLNQPEISGFLKFWKNVKNYYQICCYNPCMSQLNWMLILGPYSLGSGIFFFLWGYVCLDNIYIYIITLCLSFFISKLGW